MDHCELCSPTSEEVLWQDDQCRVVLVGGGEAVAFPGFCRVIWRAHVREMSDLPPAAQRHLLDVVMAVETVVRELVRPDKINLASLGNVVPHLHWHIIPRWCDDSHFPAPIWVVAARPVPARSRPVAADLAVALASALPQRLRLGDPA